MIEPPTAAAADEHIEDFRRMCFDEYVEIAHRRGLAAVAADGRECRRHVPWLAENLGALFSARARSRAEMAERVAAMTVAEVDEELSKIRARRFSTRTDADDNQVVDAESDGGDA